MNDQMKKVRGRPRPPETIARDEAVLALLRSRGALSRNRIAEELGEEKVKVWLALDRLRRDGLVRTCAHTSGPGLLWSAEVDWPCP